VNLLLLDDADFRAETRAVVSGRRLEHVRRVHRAEPGESLRVGRIGGSLGSGRILRIDEDALELEVRLDAAPPPPSPIELVVALPRPPSLRKVLQQATAMGVKRLTFIGSRRVEKSYWQSHALRPEALREQLLLGLEQARDTILPQVDFQRRFRPFVEDELPGRPPGLLAEPDAPAPCPRGAGARTLIVGPEGGFIPFERELLEAQGVEPVGLGPRVLRVETAVVALLARLAA
jgi:RsmE family RNA methyltransferase